MSDMLKVFGKDHLMFDIETLSNKQNALIVSIGAVKFTFEDGVKDKFLVNIDPKDAIKYGFDVNADTIEWWKKQPKAASDAWKINPQPIEEALNNFNDFVGKDKNQWIWSQGLTFDCGVVSFAFQKFDIARNWKYWNESDSRTVFNLLGIRNDKLRAKGDNHHSALDDAIAQAETLIEALT